MQSKMADFKYSAFAAKWSQKGDKMSKLFFDVVTPRPRKFQMGALKRDDGTLATDPDEMRELASRYYEQLLSVDEVSQNVLEMRGIVFGTTKPCVTNRMVQTLLCPFASFEVLQALKSLGSEVCPGEDGLVRDVFLQYWDIIGDDLTSAFQIIFDSGAMPEEWKEGLICLIPKGDGASEDIRAWRPITLLNIVYKIYAKVLALRLQPLLPDIIHTS